MRWIKTYEQYSLFVNLDDVIKNSKLVELDFESVFDTYDTDLEKLVDRPEFLKELNKNDLVATDIKYTKNLATLIKKPFKYVLLNVINNDPSTKVQNTKYILIQEDNLDKIRLFNVTKNLENFFNKLTNKIIKFTSDETGKKYIYVTYNGGKNWELQNTRDENNIFKKLLSLEEVLKIIKSTADLSISVTN